MKTASLWGRPPTRFYRFLNMVVTVSGSDPELAVLGCADGKFVLPAARKGVRVLAVDVDPIALYGGTKPGIGGVVIMPGLASRLRTEGLSARVQIICDDFTRVEPKLTSAVFVSGAIQYSYNLPRTAAELMGAILGFVCAGGLLYMDYMLPYETKYIGRPNCPNADWWRSYIAGLSGWSVLHHRILPPTRDHAHVEFPIDHFHQWGHLLMRRS